MKLNLPSWMIVVILCLATGYNNCYSKNYTIEGSSIQGVVKNNEGMPVAFANVSVKETGKGTVTNKKGFFQVYDLSPGNYQLKVSIVGYETVIKDIVVGNELVLDLGEIIIQAGIIMPEMSVIDHKDRLFSKTPGSVSYLDDAAIRSLKPISANEVLRRIPGLNLVDEEGVGMRVNIGIRGLDPDRSGSVLMLEDGVPVALAPYGEPQMYYSPVIDRMIGIEVLKGAGQILYGPQTIGGVVNYITANPPAESEGSIRLQGGQGGYFSGLVKYGNTFGNTGVQVNLLRKSAEKIGPTEFGITDFNTKFLIKLSEKSELGAKMSIYDENSNSTYIGLNQVMYDRGGQDYVRMAPDDRLDVSRYSLSFSHVYRFNPDLKLRTIAYGYTTVRNWNRQDFRIDRNNKAPSNATGVVWGDIEIPGGAVFMRDGTGQRNRQFKVGGIEPRLELNHDLFGKHNELKTGVRFLAESALEQRVNGTKAGVKSGTLRDDELRTGKAFSAYFQNETQVSEAFTIYGGLRFENFNYERNIYRRQFGDIGIRDTSLVASSSVNEIIPGLGFTVKPLKSMTLFGGVHKGFAPPRTKDAITSGGEPLDLRAERSWNYEVGIRSELSTWGYLEATGFLMDFSNKIIPVSESAGGLGTGLVNAGATRHQGVEASFVFDLTRALNLKKWAIDYDLQLTYVNAYYSEDRFVDEINIKGNKLPYAPEWLVNSSLGIRSQSGLALRFTYNLSGDQFGDELNTEEPSLDGRTGLLPSFFTLDGVLSYELKNNGPEFYLSVKNLTDERYIASRRPQGIKVGIPRFVTAGVNIDF